MKHIFILRHAKARSTSLTGDHGRHLNEKGRQRAALIGTYLTGLSIQPDIILSSSATRTLETVECLRPFLPDDIETIISDRLYLAPISRILEELWALKEDYYSVLLVGHNPGLHDLAYSLNQKPEEALGLEIRNHFPTTALALFELAVDQWHEIDLRKGHLLKATFPSKLQSQ